MAEYKVRAPLRWRQAEGHIELRDPKHNRDIKLEGWTGPVLEAIAREAPLAEIVPLTPANEGVARDKRRERRARRFLFSLGQMGYLDIPVEAPPQEIAGRYRRMRELGRGGVGVAYLYEDVQEARRVVVKRAWDFLQPYRVTEEAMRREVAVLARLDHPGIVRLLDTAAMGERLLIVREFLDGRDLASVASEGIPDVRTRRSIAIGVADVLAHLHGRGFLLLDLRPANFLLGAAGRPVLIDVGQCREHGGGAIEFPRKVGSPGFTSPEMQRERRVDVRADVWGLGRLLAHLGRGSFAASATSASLVARAPAEDRELLEQLLADDPATRPADGAAARALLEGANA